MAVTAKFVTDRIDALPNVAAALTLRLYNDDATTRDVTLAAAGDLHDHARLDRTSASARDQPDRRRSRHRVPAIRGGGRHTHAHRRGTGRTATRSDRPAPTPVRAVTATATIELAVHSDYTIALQPTRSRGSSSGRHSIRLANTGNVAVTVELSTDDIDDSTSPSSSPRRCSPCPQVLRTRPRSASRRRTTYWSGPSHDHHFAIDVTSADGRSEQLDGVYRQRPRVPNWLGPAAAGALAALIIGAIAWFAFLRPWVEETSDQAAADAIEQDRAALRERIDELEAAAAEAEELPLGTPTDIRLDVDPAGGNGEQAVETLEPGTILSITDVVLQNPTGAVGTVSWLRGDEVILQSELANFRDFDLHFVAPYQFAAGDEIVLEVDCRTPGAGQSTCPIGASLRRIRRRSRLIAFSARVGLPRPLRSAAPAEVIPRLDTKQLCVDVGEEVGLAVHREAHRTGGCVRQDDDDVGEGSVGIDDDRLALGHSGLGHLDHGAGAGIRHRTR